MPRYLQMQLAEEYTETSGDILFSLVKGKISTRRLAHIWVLDKPMPNPYLR